MRQLLIFLWIIYVWLIANYIASKKFNWSCSEPKIINQTTHPISPRDTEALNRAKFVCGFRYNSCLKTFIIKENYNYICGK